MPTYTYKCKKCTHEMDVFHSISAEPEICCESCGDSPMERLIGTGSGIIFKGSGFYETDYKKDGKSATKRDSKPHAGGESTSETKSESKTESKSSSSSSNGSGAAANSTSAA